MDRSLNNHADTMATISHELRTPITHIVGMVSFLSESLVTSQQAEYLQHIRDSALSLLKFEKRLQNVCCTNKK